MGLLSSKKTMGSLQQQFVAEAEVIKEDNLKLAAKSVEKQAALQVLLEAEQSREANQKAEVDEANIFIENVKGLFIKKETK